MICLQTLKVHGKGLVRLSVEPQKLSQTGGGPEERVYVIKGLEIKSLDVSKTSIKQLWQISQVESEVLNIAGAEIQDLSAIQNFKRLHTLIIDKSQFTKTQLALIPKHIKVIKN